MFKEEKVATLRILAALIAISALSLPLAGVIVPGLYKPIASDEAIPFTFGQDVISLVAAIVLLIDDPRQRLQIKYCADWR